MGLPLNRVKLLCVIAGFSTMSLLAVGNTAVAQYFSGNNDAQPTPAQLEECEKLGIEPSDCTENSILAKKRLMAAQQVPATGYGELVTLTAVGNGNLEGSQHET